MLFSSFVFIFAFLPLVWVGFHLLKSEVFARFYNGICARFCAKVSPKTNSYTFAKIFLISASLFFYAFWKLAYLPILLGSIVVNYALAKLILKANLTCGDITESLTIKSNSTNNNGGGGRKQQLDSSLDSCHIERSEISQNKNAGLQNPLDSSLCTSTSLKNDKLDLDCHESLRDSRNDNNTNDLRGSILEKKSGLCEASNEIEHTSSSRQRAEAIHDFSPKDNALFKPKFYFTLGIIFNLCLLGFFKYTDFLLENFNTFSQITHLDFDIPLPHILLPLALSFVTFQQIAFLFDCYKHAKGELNENLNLDFIDYALFISFFPQLIAGPIVHHREMMPQFARMSANSPCSDFSGNASAHFVNEPPSSISSLASHNPENSSTMLEFADSSKSNKSSLRDLLVSPASASADSWQSQKITSDKNMSLKDPRDCHEKSSDFSRNDRVKSTINYEYLAKGIFIFSIGLFKKVFIADSFAKWANAGFSKVENGAILNVAESWATSLSYTFQLYFDFSGYCDMAMGLGLMFGIILPLNFNSPYKSLNIAEFWRRWHITLGRFLRECLYIPFGGNRVGKILTLRNLFIVAFLSGIWHGAGWGFVIWGVLHGIAMVVHRIYAWWLNGNLFWGNHLRHFYTKLRSMNALVLSRLFRVKTAQSTTAITSIVLNANRAKSAKLNESSLRDSTQRVESWQSKSRSTRFTQSKIYKILCWFITFNFVNIAWIFFRAENLQGAVNLLKGMFGVVWIELPQKWYRMPEALSQIDGRNDTIFYIIIAIFVCLAFRNSFEKLQNFSPTLKNTLLTITLTVFALFTMLANDYSPFLYFNF